MGGLTVPAALVISVLVHLGDASGSYNNKNNNQQYYFQVDEPVTYFFFRPIGEPEYFYFRSHSFNSRPGGVQHAQRRFDYSRPSAGAQPRVIVQQRRSFQPTQRRTVSYSSYSPSYSYSSSFSPSSSGQQGRLYLSWQDPQYGRGAEFQWYHADDICRGRGQRLVSIQTREKSDYINDIIRKHGIKFIWTSGRRDDYGYFMWGTGEPVRPLNWSHTGKLGLQQPDNREGSEDCLAVLNNFYGDGVAWHDIGCTHKKAFICE